MSTQKTYNMRLVLSDEEAVALVTYARREGYIPNDPPLRVDAERRQAIAAGLMRLASNFEKGNLR